MSKSLRMGGKGETSWKGFSGAAFVDWVVGELVKGATAVRAASSAFWAAGPGLN